MQLLISSNFEEVGARFIRASEAATAVIGTQLTLAAEDAREVFVPVLKSVTPRRTGALADSTRGEIETAGMEAVVDIVQDAETKPDQSGRWGGQHYVKWLVLGRGPVRPIYKKALAGPGFGPVAYARAAPPHDYPRQAAEQAEPSLLGVMDRAGRMMAGGIVAVLR